MSYKKMYYELHKFISKHKFCKHMNDCIIFKGFSAKIQLQNNSCTFQRYTLCWQHIRADVACCCRKIQRYEHILPPYARWFREKGSSYLWKVYHIESNKKHSTSTTKIPTAYTSSATHQQHKPLVPMCKNQKTSVKTLCRPPFSLQRNFLLHRRLGRRSLY